MIVQQTKLSSSIRLLLIFFILTGCKKESNLNTSNDTNPTTNYLTYKDVKCTIDSISCFLTNGKAGSKYYLMRGITKSISMSLDVVIGDSSATDGFYALVGTNVSILQKNQIGISLTDSGRQYVSLGGTIELTHKSGSPSVSMNRVALQAPGHIDTVFLTGNLTCR